MNYFGTAIATAAFGLSAVAASAATYEFDVASTGDIGTLTCDNCEWVDSTEGYDLSDTSTDGSGFLSSGDVVELFNIDPNANSEANEILNLNQLMGLTLDVADFSREVVSSWSGDGEGWTIFKFGQGTQDDARSHLFVFNFGGSMSYEGGGLSHVTFGKCVSGLYTSADAECDDPGTVIPLPAAGWLLLGGLGGLAALRRRKEV